MEIHPNLFCDACNLRSNLKKKTQVKGSFCFLSDVTGLDDHFGGLYCLCFELFLKWIEELRVGFEPDIEYITPPEEF